MPIISGVFDITNTENKILKKGKAPEGLSGNMLRDANLLVEWVLANANELLRENYSHSIDTMRIDHQPGVAANNSAIQNNCSPKSNSKSFSSVQTDHDCFGIGGLGVALSRAHAESIRTKMIHTVSLNADRHAAANAPPVIRAPATWTCSKCAAVGNPRPDSYKSGKLQCLGCYEFVDPG